MVFPVLRHILPVCFRRISPATIHTSCIVIPSPVRPHPGQVAPKCLPQLSRPSLSILKVVPIPFCPSPHPLVVTLVYIFNAHMSCLVLRAEITEAANSITWIPMIWPVFTLICQTLSPPLQPPQYNCFYRVRVCILFLSDSVQSKDIVFAPV